MSAHVGPLWMDRKDGESFRIRHNGEDLFVKIEGIWLGHRGLGNVRIEFDDSKNAFEIDKLERLYQHRKPTMAGTAADFINAINADDSAIETETAKLTADEAVITADNSAITTTTATQTSDQASLGALLNGTHGAFPTDANGAPLFNADGSLTVYVPDGKGGYTLSTIVSAGSLVAPTPAAPATPTTAPTS